MKRTYYSERPPEFERQKFSAVLRLDIQEHPANGEAQGDTPQFSALEFRLADPYAQQQNAFVETAFVNLFGNDYEAKLINEYNAAKLGLYPDGVMEQKITRYRAFLQERAAYKSEIERICNDHGIL
jgi:hypothetical protein